MQTEGDALYSRGKYRLAWDRRSDGSLRSPYLQIVWYDPGARRERSRSTGTAQIAPAEDALDRLYLERERGQAVCPTCNRPFDQTAGVSVNLAVSDYLIECEDRPSIGSIRPRLAHFQDFMFATGRDDILCDQVDEGVISAFRRWSEQQPVIEGGKERQRAAGTTEASVRILAAAINAAHRRKDTPFPAAFTAMKPSDVSRTPMYRSDVAELATMFRYCVYPQPPKGEEWTEKMLERQKLHRRSLLRFLQISVATWCRPDAAHEFSTEPRRDQWHSAARVVRLNPRGRRQTKKYRPDIPVPEKFARILDRSTGPFVPVASVRKAFEAMLNEMGLPRERETGMKLIRRSVSQIARRRMGEERWPQGEMMLGHRKASISDLYALFDPANLGVALATTTEIIDEIENLCAGAFTGPAPELKVVSNVR